MPIKTSKKVVKTPRKVLWGRTTYGPHVVKIYKSFVNPGYDGLTWNRRDYMSVEINAEVFEQESLLDETILHEFIHCIENAHGLDWQHKVDDDGGSCCQAVHIIANGLAQMLRELTQV